MQGSCVNEKLWNKNYILLWQGQLISDLGNALFTITLSFWVLQTTNSTALMGTILASFYLPHVILGPFSGAVTDRFSRKALLVFSDGIRGMLFVLAGVLIFLNHFPFPLIYPLVIVSGICSSFFNPAAASIIPDIVAEKYLTKANSFREMSTSLSQMIGASAGGILYSMLSQKSPNEAAVAIFTINGLSFVYSAVSQFFMKVPHKSKTTSLQRILSEMMEGIQYTLGHKGLKILIFVAMVINFFAMMGMELFAPLYNETPGFGTQNYGYSMGLLMAGGVIGLFLISVSRVGKLKRYSVFVASVSLMIASMAAAALIKNVYAMFGIAFLVGGFYSVTNVIRQTIVQITTPTEMLGKVFGIIGAFVEGLMPISMAAGGVIAEFAGVRTTMLFSFVFAGFAVIPMFISGEFKDFMNLRTSWTDKKDKSV